MEALVFFCGVNSHPLGKFLKPGFGHCWIAIRDTDQGIWISYDWREGLPLIRSEAVESFDLAQHYKDQGQRVVRVTVNENYFTPALIVNNCVGQSKVMLGIRGFSFTPWQLYKSLISKDGCYEII